MGKIRIVVKVKLVDSFIGCGRKGSSVQVNLADTLIQDEV